MVMDAAMALPCQAQVQAATSSTSSPEQSDAHYAQQALRLELGDRVADIFARLKWAAAARGKLRDVRRLMVGDGGGAEVVPLVRQVLAKILLQVGGVCGEEYVVNSMW